MFCPNCGANNSTTQKFCRSCGINLEKTAESLMEQLPNAESANLLKQNKWLEKLGVVAGGGLITVYLVGISALVYVIILKLIVSGTTDKIFFGIFLIALIIFATLMLAYVVFNEMINEKKAKLNPALETEVKSKDTARLLEDKPFEPVPSVTDDTTELLYSEQKTGKLE